jgi:alkanesulfonate monooxygenase SsuD/methylene tetrahydromethanopterin reductase-like flavin-dependent oxidoreductase (luciferase family)
MYEQLGSYGAWLHPALGDDARVDYAAELEELGFQTIWAGIGIEPVDDFALLERLLKATNVATIASAILNVWRDPADSVATSYHRLADQFGSRLLLGVGVGHPESIQSFQRPLRKYGALHRNVAERRGTWRGIGHRRVGTEDDSTGRRTHTRCPPLPDGP